MHLIKRWMLSEGAEECFGDGFAEKSWDIINISVDIRDLFLSFHVAIRSLCVEAYKVRRRTLSPELEIRPNPPSPQVNTGQFSRP